MESKASEYGWFDSSSLHEREGTCSGNPKTLKHIDITDYENSRRRQRKELIPVDGRKETAK